MIKKMSLLMLFFLTGIASAQAMNHANTLAVNDAIPNALIENQVDENTASVLLETPYKGFYEIRSQIKKKRITFGKVVTEESFPDQRWNALAKGIAALVELPAYSTGSHIDPKATAFVVLYDLNIEGVDRSNVMLLPTNANREPNTLAVLVIKHQNHSTTQDVLGIRKNSAHENGNSIYFFELAL